MRAAAAWGKSRTLEQLNAQHEPAPETDKIESVLAPTKLALILGGVAQALISVLQVVPYILFAEVARLFLQGLNARNSLM
ncbi:MAG: hypothetical protein Q4A82_03420 [Corynebacterium sp.]|nr:hypothetical protein [Corynebacterium sp.]